MEYELGSKLDQMQQQLNELNIGVKVLAKCFEKVNPKAYKDSIEEIKKEIEG